MHTYLDPTFSKEIQQDLLAVLEAAEMRFDFGDCEVLEVEIDDDSPYEAEAGPSDESGSYLVSLSSELLKDREKLLTTFAHELVHVHQYATGRLRPQGQAFIWEGESFYIGAGITRATYFEFPWEREAYGWERAIYERAMDAIEHKKNFIQAILEVDNAAA